MRRILAVMTGVLVAVALMPTAADAVETQPTATPSATATAPASTATATATASPTATESPSASPEPTDTPTDDPIPDFPDVLEGTLTLTPAYGPAGSTATVTSKTPCVADDGSVGPAVEVLVLDSASLDAGDEIAPFYDKVLPTDAKGHWTTQFTVPAAAQDGEILVAIAACFDSADVTDTSEPFLVYDPKIFMVTTADEAPPAEPVPGEPDFTG